MSDPRERFPRLTLRARALGIAEDDVRLLASEARQDMRLASAGEHRSPPAPIPPDLSFLDNDPERPDRI